MDARGSAPRGLIVRVLVVNSGSSSLKLSLLDGNELLRRDEVEVGPDGMDTGRLGQVLREWPSPDAVGHRIVHGGVRFTGAAIIDPAVERALHELTALAPLHQPASLAAVDAVTTLLPDTIAVACFDTAFHAGLPAAASTYALPAEWRDKYDIRRYGFHGLSHAYCAARSAELLGRPLDGTRIVTCHLGAGASLAAVLDGHSVDTTMGFTPLDGLVMATRSGSVDPGLILWLVDHEHLSATDVSTTLEHRSGLLALTGSADMRVVEAAVARSDRDAILALDVYIHRLVGGIATMTAALGGLDILAFTGGVGEHSALVRRRTAERLGFLGVGVGEANEHAQSDCDITAAGHPVSTVVITAREDLQIAREVRRVLHAASPSPNLKRWVPPAVARRAEPAGHPTDTGEPYHR